MKPRRNGLVRDVQTPTPAMSMRRRSEQAGFSLIEAMISAAILGLALMGLVQLHKTSIQGTVKATAMGRASEVARQLAETASSVDFADLPPCLPGAGPAGAVLGPAPQGCRGSIAPSTVWAGQKANGCTYYVESAAIPSVDPGYNPDGAVNPTLKYRVDIAVSQHPDNGVPPSNYPDTAVVTVWVCWEDERGIVQELSTTRLVTSGL